MAVRSKRPNSASSYQITVIRTKDGNYVTNRTKTLHLLTIYSSLRESDEIRHYRHVYIRLGGAYICITFLYITSLPYAGSCAVFEVFEV